MALLQLLKMTGKGKKAFLLLKRVLLQLPKMAGCGAATAAKNVLLLLKMVLLLLPKMAGKGVIAASEGIATAKDGAAAAAKDGQQCHCCSC